MVVLNCFRSPKYEVVDTKVINNYKALIHGVVGSVCAWYVDLGPEVLGLGVQKTRDSGSLRLASWSGGLFLGLSSPHILAALDTI